MPSTHSAEEQPQPVMMTYLLSIYMNANTIDRVGVRNGRELKTLATALDHLARGELDQLADVLMQRYKAVEMSIADGTWTLAQRIELITDQGVGLVSNEEHVAAARAAMLIHKLDEVKKKAKSK